MQNSIPSSVPENQPSFDQPRHRASSPKAEIKPDRFISFNETVKRTGLSRSTLYVYISRGSFPKPYQVGVRAVRFRLTEVETWCSERTR